MAVKIIVTAGADFNRVGHFTVGGTLTRLEDIVCQIRKAASKDAAIVLDLAPFITQDDDGVVLISVPGSDTAALDPGSYWIDMFGTAGGVRYKPIPTLPCVVAEFVSVTA